MAKSSYIAFATYIPSKRPNGAARVETVLRDVLVSADRDLMDVRLNITAQMDAMALPVLPGESNFYVIYRRVQAGKAQEVIAEYYYP
jgi:hypothetical protein